MAINRINNMGKPQSSSIWGNATAGLGNSLGGLGSASQQQQQLGAQQANGSSVTINGSLAPITSNTITIGNSSSNWGVATTGIWGYNAYTLPELYTPEQMEKYGKDMIEKWTKMREMSLEEFAKLEFYKDILE